MNKNDLVGDLYKNATKIQSKDEIPMRYIQTLAKELGQTGIHFFENLLNLEQLPPEIKEFAILNINDVILDKISNVDKINFIKSYLIDNVNNTQTIFVVYF